MTFKDGRTVAVQHLLPPAKQAYLFPHVSILNAISYHLATATVAGISGAENFSAPFLSKRTTS